jgi:hypothetical protein
MRATEAGTDTTEIVAEKNRLRDITTLADSCTTPAELRALNTSSVPPAVEESVVETPVVEETPEQGA